MMTITDDQLNEMERLAIKSQNMKFDPSIFGPGDAELIWKTRAMADSKLLGLVRQHLPSIIQELRDLRNGEFVGGLE